MEGSKTIVFFMAKFLAPAWFPPLAYAFAGLTLMSALGRVGMAWNAFRDKGPEWRYPKNRARATLRLMDCQP